MSTTILGKNQAIRQPDGYRYDPLRGWQTIVRYRGTKAKILELIPQFNSTGCTVDVFSQNGVVWELQASSPQALDGSVEAPIDIWETFSNTVEKDLLNSTAASGISETDKVKIRSAIQNPNADGSEPTPAFTGAALTIYRLLKINISSFPQSYITIRHTQMVSSQYSVQTAYTNVNAIYKTSSLGAPSSFLVALPASGAGRTDAGGFNFGWRKKPPQAQTVAYNKIQIVQEFDFNEWSAFMYGGLI